MIIFYPLKCTFCFSGDKSYDYRCLSSILVSISATSMLPSLDAFVTLVKWSWISSILSMGFLPILQRCSSLSLYQMNCRSMQKRRRDSRKLVVSKIHSHLKRFMLEATFLVERLIVEAAIKNDLIASHGTRMLRREADDSLSQMLPSSAGIHNNVLNVPNFAAISQKFLLNKHAPRRNDLSRSLVFNHADNVIISNGTELSKSILEVCVRDGIANAELLQQLDEAFALV